MEKITSECRRYLAIANDELLPPDRKIPVGTVKIKFTKKGRAAATATTLIQLGLFELNFNPVLCGENFEDAITQTVPHEVAHIVANHKYRKQCGHGPLWKGVMRAFGKAPERFHTYDTLNAMPKGQLAHKVVCGCGKDFTLTQRVVQRSTDGSSRFLTRHCKSCKGRLVVWKTFRHNGKEFVEIERRDDAHFVATTDQRCRMVRLPAPEKQPATKVAAQGEPAPTPSPKPEKPTKATGGFQVQYDAARALVEAGNFDAALETLCKGSKGHREVALRVAKLVATLYEAERQSMIKYLHGAGVM